MGIHRLDLDIGRWTFGYWISGTVIAFDTVKVQPIRHSTAKNERFVAGVPGKFTRW
jgi:hypothetical protein